MNKKFNAIITIGGAVSSTLGSAFGSTRTQMKKVAGEIKGIKDQQKSLSALMTHYTQMGRDVSGLTLTYVQLSNQLTKLQGIQERLNKVNTATEANLKKRSEYRAQLFDAVALGATLAAPVRAAMAEESFRFRLSTVINKPESMAISIKAAREVAKSGLSNLQEAYNSQYALYSAGFDEVGSKIGSKIALGISKITGGEAEGVTEVIATAYNNLGKNLSGTTEEKLTRIGDILTKTQFKFQIRDFNQLGESFKYAFSSLAGLNINFEQGATLLGQLNTAGLQGSMAGTAFSGMLRNLGKAAAQYNFQIKRTKDGQMDLIGTLHLLDTKLKGLNLDQRQAAVQKIFGDEGARAVIPLLNNIKELDAAYKDVNENSKGLVQENVARYLQTSEANMQKLKSSVDILGASLGTVLLPPLKSVIDIVSKGITPIVEFAQKHQRLTGIIVGSVASFIAIKVAAIALGYAFTFLKGGVLLTTSAIVRMRAAALLTQTALGPVGLAIAAVSIAAILLWKNWDKVVKVFRIGKAKIQPVLDWMSQKLEGVGAVLKGVGHAFGFGKSTQQANSIGNVVAARDSANPSTANPLSRASTNSDNTTQSGSRIQNSRSNVNNPINITVNAAPGQSEHKIANKVMGMLKDKQGQTQRSYLFDGAY